MVVSKNKLDKIIYAIMFLGFALLTYFLIYYQHNNLNEYLFTYAYYLLIIYIFTKTRDAVADNRFRFISLFQVILIIITSYFQIYIITKILVLIGVILGASGAKKQLTEDIKQRETIEHLTLHDELTGLYNRRYFQRTLEKLENMAVFRPISIIIADINNLKEINDNYGHSKGDQYIRKAGELFQSVLRKGDIIARIGGDEFAIILHNTNSKECQRVIEKIKEVSDQFTFEKDGIAFGYATNYDSSVRLEDTMITADTRMYEDKRSIKNGMKAHGKKD